MPKKQTYTVKAGDNWAKIAGKIYGNQRMFEELMRMNKDISMLRAGQTLVLPTAKKNPYVSNFGAAATGMATEFSNEGVALNTPAGPAATPGVNVMNPYMMSSLSKGGNGFTGGTAANTATAPKPTGWTSASENAAAAPKPAPMPSAPGPTATAGNAATMYAQQASGQARPQGSNIVGASPTADVMYAQRASNRVNVPGVQKPPQPQQGFKTPQMSDMPKTQPQGGRFGTNFNVPGTTQPSATDTQTAAATAQAAATPRAAVRGTNESQKIALDLYSQIDRFAVGAGGSLPPSIHASNVQGMAFYTGHSAQSIADSLEAMGYVYDDQAHTYYQPGQAAAQYGASLPAYVSYGTTSAMNAGGGGNRRRSNAPQYTAQAGPSLQGPDISGNWRIGK